MKLTALLLTIAIFQVRGAVLAQSVSLKGKDLSLKTVLAEIKSQTGYAVFLSDKNLLSAAGTVSVSVTDMPLTDFLDAVLKDLGMAYVIVGKNISIVRKPATTVVMGLQVLPVKGRVTDASGAAIQGVTVRILKTNIGTVTDAQGDFNLSKLEDGATLEISMVGYSPILLRLSGGKFSVLNQIRADEKEEVSILENSNPSALMIKLGKSTSQLDGVTVSTGYWTTTQRKSTGNIYKVTSKEMEKQPLNSPLLALQGRVPGLDISLPNAAPGVAPKIRIRGENSLRYDGGNPLYVVDGVIIDSKPLYSQTNHYAYTTGIDPLVNLGIENIESIEILKDADATAIYGSQGANGVVLITSKKGTTDGRTSLDIGAYRGFGKVPMKLSLLDTKEYLMMRNEAFANAGVTPGMYDYDVTFWDTTRYTDWQDVLLSGTSDITDISGSFSGGSRLSSFRMAGAYYKETSFMPGNFANKRVNGSFSYNHRSPNQKLNIQLSVTYGFSHNEQAASSSLITSALTLPPNAPPLYNPDGSINWAPIDIGNNIMIGTFVNPMGELLNTHKSDAGTLTANTNVSYDILPGLSARINIGYTTTNEDEISKRPSASRYVRDPATESGGYAYFSSNDRSSWSSEADLGYRKKFGLHQIDAIAGINIRDSRYSRRGVTAQGYSSDEFLDILTASQDLDYTVDDGGQYKYAGVYGRIGYTYDDKYLVNFTGRRDGSSRFGPGRQFGNFGSVSAGWIFSEEDFLRHHVEAFSFGKMRVTYGITGNDQIGDYEYLSLYNIGGNTYQGGGMTLIADGLYNPNYHWESTKKLDATVNIGLFKDRIMLDASWYRNRSTYQLINYKLPYTTGFASVFQNFNATVENKGWEFVLNTRNIDGRKFKWLSTFNFTIPQNKLLSFPGIETSPYRTSYKVGQPLSIQRLYSYAGVDPQTGSYIIRDINNDGQLNYYDQEFGRHMEQKYYGGVINTFNYGPVELSFLMQFATRPVRSAFPAQPGYGFTNQHKNVLNRWQKPGDITNIGRFDNSFEFLDQYVVRVASSDYGMLDGTFFRLKTLTLSYNMQKLVENVKLRDAYIYIQAQNLLTFTDFVGLDSEIGVMEMPQLRMITFGLRCKI